MPQGLASGVPEWRTEFRKTSAILLASCLKPPALETTLRGDAAFLSSRSLKTKNRADEPHNLELPCARQGSLAS